jgi:hypothetical protein
MEKQDKQSKPAVEELGKMYIRTEDWVSDDDFFADEFRFLINLTDKYFIGALITDSEISGKIKDTVGRLLRLDETRMSIAKQNKEHQTYLAGLIRNKTLFDPEECANRHSDLEADQSYFSKKYRVLKKEIFRLSEQLLETESKKLNK